MDENNSNDETKTATPAIDWAWLARPLSADPRVFNTSTGWTGTKWMQVRGRTLGATEAEPTGQDQHERVLSLPRKIIDVRERVHVGHFDKIAGALFNSYAVSVLVELSESIAVVVVGPEQGLVNSSTLVKVQRSTVLIGLGDLGEPVAILVDCDRGEAGQS